MPKRRAQPVTPASLVEMALVSDLVHASEALATGSAEPARALIQAAGRKLEAVPLERWDRVFALALEVVAKREGADRAPHLVALAEVLGQAGQLAGAVEPNEGNNP